MENLYNMTIKENIEFAKRNIVDIIYQSARLEGIAVTFPDTEAIYHGVPINSNLKTSDIVTINNLKHAWIFLFDTIDYPVVDYGYLCEMNRIVGSNLITNAGFIRKLDVKIGGTNWKPEIPVESVIKERLFELNEIKNPTERAIHTALYLMRSQTFLDGNKRTAMLCANKIMISNGCGCLNLNEKDIVDFKHKLIDFYEKNDIRDIANFLYTRAIEGWNLDEITMAEKEAQRKNTLFFQNFIERKPDIDLS